MAKHIASDTHRFVKDLTDCGFSERQAEALVDGQVNLVKSNLSDKADVAETHRILESKADKADVAETNRAIADIYRILETKADKADIAEIHARFDAMNARFDAMDTRFDAMVQGTDARFEAMRSEMNAQIEATKFSVVKWGASIMFAGNGLLLAAIKLL